MKHLTYFLITFIIVSCQSANIIDSTSELSIAKKKADPINALQDNLMKVQNSSLQVGATKDDPAGADFLMNDVHLITHSQFVFLEFLGEEINPESPGYLDVSDQYDLISNSCRVYAYNEDNWTKEQELLIGKEFQVNNSTRDQFNSEVVDIVIVHDTHAELPYVAAVLELPKDKEVYYAWTSTVGSVSFPFMKKGDLYEEEADDDLINQFQNSIQFSRFEESRLMNEGYYYEEIMIHDFEHFTGVSYHVVQFNVIGECGALVENLTAVYIKKNGQYELLAMDEIEYYIQDLIDINGDGFPELLVAEFASSAIFNIEESGFKLYQEIDWSIDGCPC